ncbi:MAG: hypothetical protein Q8O56_07175 [Solirubrobacteraceae bacterium]|nr:hypothetical protein [Solirubrobacteraceae bacterium]
MLLAGLCVMAMGAVAAPAGAYWSASGSGAGSGSVATMPAGQQPSASAAGRDVTIAWTQSTFRGTPLGSHIGGGYTLTRYAQGESTPTTPNASCATTIGGATATLQCVEAGVPYGSWQYAITPRLSTFTGAEGPRSAQVAVVPAAPVLATIVRADPVDDHAVGDLRLSWSAVAGVSGYDVYRRTDSGSYPQTPLNEAPLSATTFTDPGSGLATGTSYVYVVRAIAGSPAVQSAASAERHVTPTGRPGPPATVGAVAAVGARVDVSWASVPGAAGYDVYRRTAEGSFDYAARLGGATVAGTTIADTTAVDGATYVYVVRTVIAGADGPIESFSSVQSAPVTADGTAPAPPTAVSVTNGPVLPAARCAIAAGTRFINSAGQTAVAVSATLPVAEPGATVVFSASTPGSAAVSGSAPAALPSTATLNLASLSDGALTLTAYSRDAAGNVSSATAMTAAVRKDTVFIPVLTARYRGGILGLGATIDGAAECGADVVATKGGNVRSTIATSTTYEINVGSLLGSGGWAVTATDPAGNTAVPITA